MRAVLRASVLAFVASCGGAPEVPTGPAPRPTPTFAPVIGPALVATQDAAPRPTGAVDEEELRGLVSMFSGGDARFVDAAREGVRELDGDVAGALVAFLEGETTDDGERAAVLGLLGARGDAASVEALLALVEAGEPAWVRAHAAWRLGEAGDDRAVPPLLRRLKYEKDRETVVWLADALGRLGNFCTVPVLRGIAAEETTDERVRTAAATKVVELTALAKLPEGADLEATWEDGELVPAARSDAFRHRMWSWIQRFEEYQLRGVDDARFLVERSDPTVAELLGRALSEPNRYVRVHAAQCLARMGRRARPAEAALVAVLGDRLVAHEAATALGRVDTASAEAELARELEHAPDVEVRISAARALRWRLERAGPETRALLARLADEAPLPELRQASLETLAYLDELDRTRLETLLAFGVDPNLESDTTILAVRYWLTLRDAPELLARFDELAPAGGEVIPREERVRSRHARVDLVRGALDELL